jgi:hypothetical protein
LLLSHLPVVVPPHGIAGQIVANDVFVLGAAARVDAGFGAECTTRREFGFTASEGEFIEFGLKQIPVNCMQLLEAELVRSTLRISETLFQHFSSTYGAAG